MTQADVGLDFNWKYGPSVYDIGNAAYQTVTRAFRGTGLRPLSPVHIAGRLVPDGLQISWIRRTRIGGDSWDQVEVPLGEDSEAYEVDIMDGSTAVRTLSTSEAGVTYTNDQQISDFGTPQPSYAVRVYQLGATYGRGQAREGLVP